MKNRSKIDQTSIKTSNANFGSIFIDFWTILGPMLVHLDPSWPQNGAKLAPSWIPGGSWEPPGASRSVPGPSQNPPKTLPKPQVANFDDFSSKNLEILIPQGPPRDPQGTPKGPPRTQVPCKLPNLAAEHILVFSCPEPQASKPPSLQTSSLQASKPPSANRLGGNREAKTISVFF